LTEEYGINVALHNHPKPSRYWNPDTVLKACKDHSKRIGACCDIGHWMRSGINPLEALKKLEGRIIEFHFKDLNQFDMKAHDVPWGTGKADAKALLIEVHRQGIKPVFSVEYEYHWGHSLPEIAQSVAYFDKVAAEIG
jgi:sugar phosphate isomerase/epimerase